MNKQIQLNQEQDRILSIDFYRGFTMFMLVTGISGIFKILATNQVGGDVIASVYKQMDHAEWIGLTAWDLIQPFFMFIVGVSMPFAVAKRLEKGDNWRRIFYHVLKRSLLLFLFGFMLEASKEGFTLVNVLLQLSFTYLIAFLLMRWDFKWQLVVSFALILLSDLLYHFWPLEGFNQPYIRDHNFGSWVDVVLTGKVCWGGWTSINVIPTCAHTIWGVLAGKLLMNDYPYMKKILILLITGIIAVVVGYCMNPFIPIIKHICTSSFIIVSGGYCLIAMAFSYWLIDVLKYRKIAMFFAVVGMNPIFIYLFSCLGGKALFRRMVEPFTWRLFGWGGEVFFNVVTAIVILIMTWYLCYFMYKRKLFIKL